jgi:hypothetical protein
MFTELQNGFSNSITPGSTAYGHRDTLVRIPHPIAISEPFLKHTALSMSYNGKPSWHQSGSDVLSSMNRQRRHSRDVNQGGQGRPSHRVLDSHGGQISRRLNRHRYILYAKCAIRSLHWVHRVCFPSFMLNWDR